METSKLKKILAWIKALLKNLEGTQDAEMEWRRWEYREYKQQLNETARGMEYGRFY